MFSPITREKAHKQQSDSPYRLTQTQHLLQHWGGSSNNKSPAQTGHLEQIPFKLQPVLFLLKSATVLSPIFFAIDAENGLFQPSDNVWYPQCQVHFQNCVLLSLADVLSLKMRDGSHRQWVLLQHLLQQILPEKS